MKRLAKGIVVELLALLAALVVRRYKPTIIMVTGSVGKTSTKDAIAAALSSSFDLRAAEKSFNSELGVPLTIFGCRNPWRSARGWLAVLRHGVALLVLPHRYPKLLVLEVGADRPGDMARTLRIAHPDVVVVTKLPEISVHVEAYATPAAVREEEFLPAYHLPGGGSLIICAEDTYACNLSAHLSAHVGTYGFSASASVRIKNAHFHSEGEEVRGMEAEIQSAEEEAELVIEGAIGNHQFLPAAAALAAANALGVPLAQALEGLTRYEVPPGRGRLLKGRNNTLLIDDSYNASPAAVEETLKTLKIFPSKGRKIAVLGDMLELGRYSAAEHERIGKLAKESANIVISVGPRARRMEAMMAFATAEEAATYLGDLIKAGDVILIKGSQAVRLEHIVEALLADPADSVKLVRQEKEWKYR